MRVLACGSVLAMSFASCAAHAQETTTYQYDQLGRLVSSTISGGPNTATKTATCFDSAGNRLQYSVGAGAPPACAVGVQTPTQASAQTSTQRAALAKAPSDSTPAVIAGSAVLRASRPDN